MVKMINCSNIFVIVGSSNNINLNEKEIIIWDDKNRIPIYKLLIKKKVLNLEITSDKIIVACENNIYIFDLKYFQLIDIIKTGNNPKGLFGISFRKRNILVYPSVEEIYGKLTIKNYDTKKYIYLNPHENDIINFTLSYNGNYLATQSNKDKMIKIFDAKTGNCLDKLSFADEKINEIRCISINPKNNYLLLSCKKGFIPIWSLKKAKDLIGSIIDVDDKVTNVKKGFFVKKFAAYNHVNLNELIKIDFDYEFVQPGDQNTLFIVTSNCICFRIKFDAEKTKYDAGKFEIEEMKPLFDSNNI